MTLERIAEVSKDATFRGFRCWDNEAVGQILSREAASASREVLLATHVAPPIQRVAATPGGFDERGATTQDALLDVVRNGGPMIVPIIGVSGSGKSHLVLWLREKLADTPDPNRRVIYVPKGSTSLVDVIELLLEGHEGGRYDELRDAVRNASASMDDRERALRLRAELAIRIEKATDLDDEARRYAAAQLPALLNDAGYESRLIDSGGALQRIVADATRGGNEEPAEFRDDDVLVGLSLSEVDALGARAKAFWRSLQRPQVLAATVDLLNAHLNPALSRVFGVSPMELVGVMRDLRTELHRENPKTRVVLMIEDFTLLQGIQFDLLEAMIEIPNREGTIAMAPMTTVMAVTAGFFQRMLTASDTLSGRVDDIYSLDAAYGSEGPERTTVDPRQVREFVGRYLNAVRVGPDDLARLSPEVPNACLSCALFERCHDSFGADDGERGLYPFNDVAIDRIVRSRRDTFNARDMLAVMNLTLGAHGVDIAEGRFPSAAWDAEFEVAGHGRRLKTLSLDVDRRTRRTVKGEQRARLLTFWGGVPDTLSNLRPGIHEAFDIPPITDADVVEPVVDPVVDLVIGKQSNRDDVGDLVRAWRDGERLGRDEALSVRRFIAAAVVGALDPEARMFAKPLIDQTFDRDRDVVVERAEGGGGRRAEGRFTVPVTADDTGVFLVEGILRARDPNAPTLERIQRARWDFPGGVEHLAALTAFASRYARALEAHLIELSRESRQSREALLQALYLSGLALGLGEARTAEGRLFATYSTKTRAWQHAPDRWKVLAERIENARAKARGVVLDFNQIRQGVGGVLGLDPAETIALLQQTDLGGQLDPRPDEPAYESLRNLVDALGAALDDVRADVAEWHSVVRPLLGDPDRWSESEHSLKATAEWLQSESYPLLIERHEAELPRSSEVAAALRTVDALLENWTATGIIERARLVGGLPWVRLAPIRVYAERVAEQLRGTRDRALQRAADGNAADSPLTELERSLEIVEMRLAQVMAKVTA